MQLLAFLVAQSVLYLENTSYNCPHRVRGSLGSPQSIVTSVQNYMVMITKKSKSKPEVSLDFPYGVCLFSKCGSMHSSISAMDRPMMPNGIRIRSAVFPQCTGQTDRHTYGPTDRPRESLTTIGRCATKATRPKNTTIYKSP